MNETNILADVPVMHIDANFSDMFNTQRALQARLNQQPTLFNLAHATIKAIYWSHCINAESVELLDWLEQQDDTTWIKEMQMEAIDIVHFILNIAIEFKLTPKQIEAMELVYEHVEIEIDTESVIDAVLLLNKQVIEFINLLPWKTWKTYKFEPDYLVLELGYSKTIKAMLLLCNACGLKRQDIINMYFAKNKVNHERQDNGY